MTSELEAGSLTETGPLIARHLAETERLYPELSPTREAVLEAIARAGGDERTELAELRVADLVLAAACARGEAKALALFERRFKSDLDAALRRVVRDASARDEMVQQLREKLFVVSADKKAKILDYAGRGDLRSWLRATAVRHALNAVTRARPEETLGDRLFAVLESPDADPELAHARSLYKAELKAAFADAAAALEPRDRNLLRYACSEGLSVDAIGALYGAHRATAARWVVAARERLLAGVRKSLISRLKIAPRELDSVLRVVQSGVSITLDRYLAEAAPPG